MITRLRQRAAFSAREADFVADLAAHLAQGLRTALLDTAAAGGQRALGTVLVDAHGRVEAVTPEAERWMAELTALTDRTGYIEQPRIPPAVYIVAARARAALAGGDEALPSARVRTRAGQWLVVHGSMLSGPDGPDGRAAVVIEPARPAEIAPVIVAAYHLTEREQDVLRLVCRGLGTTRSPGRCSCRPIPCAATSRRCSPRSVWAAAASWSRACSPTTTTTG